CVGASGPTAGRCRYDALHGSFGDRGTPPEGDGPNPNPDAPQVCHTAADCVPQGVDPCQPLQLKVSTAADGSLSKAWDILWDPDETRNLLDEDPAYLGGNGSNSVGGRLAGWLEDYWTLAGPGDGWIPPNQWRGPGNASTCPWAAGQ